MEGYLFRITLKRDRQKVIFVTTIETLLIHLTKFLFFAKGTVIATGPGRVHPETGILINIAVEVGENVIYGKYDGTELKYNDISHQMIKDDDILLKFKGKEATVANVEVVRDQVLVKLPPKEESNAAGEDFYFLCVCVFFTSLLIQK